MKSETLRLKRYVNEVMVKIRDIIVKEVILDLKDSLFHIITLPSYVFYKSFRDFLS